VTVASPLARRHRRGRMPGPSRGTSMRIRWDRVLPLLAVALFWVLAWFVWKWLEG